MTEKRYYKKDWEDSYYIFDSKTISENEFEEKVEYDGYDVFADSLTPKEVIDLLNDNEQLKSRVEYLERKINRERKSHFIQDEKWQTESTQQITKLKKENEKLKAQLYCDDEEGVCIICKHHYLKKGNIFYISKCEKGHEECSTDALKHCKDFEIKELQE